MIDHIGLRVGDFDRARAFCDRDLGTLGHAVQVAFGDPGAGGHGRHAGYGPPGRPAFWIGTGTAPTGGAHVAFAAADAAQVRAFHAAALAAGGTDNGPAGARPHYHPGYFGAFVLDPDGNNIEAAIHDWRG